MEDGRLEGRVNVPIICGAVVFCGIPLTALLYNVLRLQVTLLLETLLQQSSSKFQKEGLALLINCSKYACRASQSICQEGMT